MRLRTSPSRNQRPKSTKIPSEWSRAWRPGVMTAAGGVQLARTLEALPEHRQEALLWHYASTLDHDGVANLVAAGTLTCNLGEPAPPLTGARLGSDGRYHLCDGDRLICSHRRVSNGAGEWVYRHKDDCCWWSEGVQFRLQVPPGRDPETLRRRVISWKVTVHGESVEPSLVPRRQRCPVDLNPWPPDMTTSTRTGRMRRALVEALGAQCHAWNTNLRATLQAGLQARLTYPSGRIGPSSPAT